MGLDYLPTLQPFKDLKTLQLHSIRLEAMAISLEAIALMPRMQIQFLRSASERMLQKADPPSPHRASPAAADVMQMRPKGSHATDLRSAAEWDGVRRSHESSP